MGPTQWFLFVYVFGGLTFLPLLLALVILFAYCTLPLTGDQCFRPDDPAHLARPNDEKLLLKTATDDLEEKFHRKHDSDVAAGYFAVCREYVAGGVNGKPPDKLSPAGEVVATESPSVYQSMYRSIFDRSQKPTIEPNKDAAGKTIKRANNVFYVVLRHGHLMLYDDIQQLEVRYVISLEYHDVDIHGGSDTIPEGELWIKRNAIQLKKKPTHYKDKATSLPFFLFSENTSDKEDFYFALLKNQEKTVGDTPIPQEFDVSNIVTLVQKLHSSEEHLQTRWLNAMIGRLFLAMYKTPELEGFVRQKLTKKIARVKKPAFITKLALQKIYLGEGAPFITNPRLKDLTVNGDCTVEADVLYTGNFRIEVAATARIELGSRFKAREVDMVLAATVKKMQGHALVRFKPPPSNRLWFTFEKMPQLDLVLEPIVSSRQITYTVILRAIENRIREVIAETIVFPFWDDIPFSDSSGETHRGGIWKREHHTAIPTEIKNEDLEEEAEAGSSGTRTPTEVIKHKDARFMSMPVLADSRKVSGEKKSISSMNDILGISGDRTPPVQPPRVMRPTSFTTAADPLVTADHADVNGLSKEVDSNQKRDRAASILKDLSTRASPAGSQSGSPEVESSMAAAAKERPPSMVSKASNESIKNGTDRQLTMNSSTMLSPTETSGATTPTTASSNSRPSSFYGEEPKKNFTQSARSLTTADRKQALASINAATAAAQKWGWGVLARNRQKGDRAQGNNQAELPTETTIAPSMPIGRGRPLPPPGIPLPPPEKQPGIPNLFSITKRKPVPPPLLPKRPETNGAEGENIPSTPSPRPPAPQLPERRKRQSSMQNTDEVLIVEAPAESAPTSPDSEHHDDFFGHGEGSTPPAENPYKPPPPILPQRQPPYESNEEEELARPLSTEGQESASRERSLSMMEVASIGSSHNE